jgi:hypothetical protein
MPSMICRSISAVRNLLRSIPPIFSYAETCHGRFRPTCVLAMLSSLALIMLPIYAPHQCKLVNEGLEAGRRILQPGIGRLLGFLVPQQH